MDGRNTTSPMAILKNEEELSIQKTKTNAALPHSSLSKKVRSILPPLNPPNSNRLILPEIEIPPRFQPILERVVRNHPELVEKRYKEFLALETMGANATVQEADKIKLYIVSDQTTNSFRTRIYIPPWAEKYINDQKRSQG